MKLAPEDFLGERPDFSSLLTFFGNSFIKR